MNRTVPALFALVLLPFLAAAEETIFIEAEHLHGIKGYCWPSGRPELRKASGNWGLSGPGWAAGGRKRLPVDRLCSGRRQGGRCHRLRSPRGGRVSGLGAIPRQPGLLIAI